MSGIDVGVERYTVIVGVRWQWRNALQLRSEVTVKVCAVIWGWG